MKFERNDYWKEAYKWKDKGWRIATPENEPLFCEKCHLRIYTGVERGRGTCTGCEPLEEEMERNE
jgi:hypothetical protein